MIDIDNKKFEELERTTFWTELPESHLGIAEEKLPFCPILRCLIIPMKPKYLIYNTEYVVNAIVEAVKQRHFVPQELYTDINLREYKEDKSVYDL